MLPAGLGTIIGPGSGGPGRLYGPNIPSIRLGPGSTGSPMQEDSAGTFPSRPGCRACPPPGRRPGSIDATNYWQLVTAGRSSVRGLCVHARMRSIACSYVCVRACVHVRACVRCTSERACVRVCRRAGAVSRLAHAFALRQKQTRPPDCARAAIKDRPCLSRVRLSKTATHQAAARVETADINAARSAEAPSASRNEVAAVLAPSTTQMTSSMLSPMPSSIGKSLPALMARSTHSRSIDSRSRWPRRSIASEVRTRLCHSCRLVAWAWLRCR
jgi:hypothetical protein